MSENTIDSETISKPAPDTAKPKESYHVNPGAFQPLITPWGPGNHLSIARALIADLIAAKLASITLGQ